MSPVATSSFPAPPHTFVGAIAGGQEVDTASPGGVTLPHDSRLHHIKVGRRHAGTRVLMLVAGLDVRIVSEDGELLRELVLDPTRDYQPMG